MCHSFSSSLIANQNMASAKENAIAFHMSYECVSSPCSHAQKTKDPSKEQESASEEPTLQKAAARIWQCPQTKAILHLGYKNTHPN